MGNLNRRGQVLIESIFVILLISSLLILFQMMIDQQRKETNKYRLTKTKKDFIYVPKNEVFKAE